MEQFTSEYEINIAYVTSDKTDPLLAQELNNIETFFIFSKSALITFFETLDADILAMTMPDLGNYHIKRSRHPVHYVYIHHSMVSTHMIYRTGAFDNFDSILCVGPHQMEETRQWEKEFGLEPKQLFQHGYAPLDTILASKPENYQPPVKSEETKIIIAPSWGPHGLLETAGEDVVKTLLDSGYKVIVRPHPRTRQLSPNNITSMKKRFGGTANFSMEEDVKSFDSYLASDILLSDWSGAALEFAFGLERPVLFIDLPPKVNNPDYDRIKAIPIEKFIRNKIGRVVKVNSIEQISSAIEDMMQNYESLVATIGDVRDEWIFNVSKSHEKGAQLIFSIYQDTLKN